MASELVKLFETASIGIYSGSLLVSGSELKVLGRATASKFLAEETGSIAFVGSASFAPNTDSASLAVASETASFVGSGSIVSGGLVVATVGPLNIAFNSTLGSFVNLTSIGDEIAELGSGLSRTKIDISGYNEMRVSVAMTDTDDKGNPVQLGAQWSVDEVDWEFFTSGTGAYLTQSNTTAATDFQALVSESKQDVFMRLVTFSGSASPPGATAKVGLINVFFG